jgi:hypothetical protein
MSSFSIEDPSNLILKTSRNDYFKSLIQLNIQKSKPNVLGTDEIFSLAANILDIQDQISHPLSFPKFVHMKPMIQDLKKSVFKWSRDIGLYTNSIDDYKIGSFSQYDIIHYVEKDLNFSNLIDQYNQKMKSNFKL